MRHKYAAWIKEVAYLLDSQEVPRPRQEDLGWTDFQADPEPATEHLYEFVGVAVELCCFDEEGRWCRDDKVLYAMVNAIETLSSIKVSDRDLAELYDLARKGDAKMDEIKFWLQIRFGPNAAP